MRSPFNGKCKRLQILGSAIGLAVAVNLAISKLVNFGKLPVSLQAGVGYWAESPDIGPEGFRARLQANIVLPKW